MKIVFVVPSSTRSGGIRVTVEMANHLLNAGHDVRLAIRTSQSDLRSKLKKAIKPLLRKVCVKIHDTWIQDFKGKVYYYKNLEDLTFEEGEIVIAVGPIVVQDVFNLRQNVYKMRYFHGFFEQYPDLMSSALRPQMATMAVSALLGKKIEEYSNQPVEYIIPDAINHKDYFNEHRPRDGIGTIYHPSYLKAPEETMQLLKAINMRWPFLKKYVFGTSRRPKEISRNSYWRYPSVEKSRELYNRSKIWLVTSRSEGFSLQILEAMACGCAVISTDQMGARTLIKNNENGVIVPFGDINAFTRSIDMLLNDEQKRLKIAEKGLETVKEYTWGKSAQKMEQALKDVFKKHITSA